MKLYFLFSFRKKYSRQEGTVFNFFFLLAISMLTIKCKQTHGFFLLHYLLVIISKRKHLLCYFIYQPIKKCYSLFACIKTSCTKKVISKQNCQCTVSFWRILINLPRIAFIFFLPALKNSLESPQYWTNPLMLLLLHVGGLRSFLVSLEASLAEFSKFVSAGPRLMISMQSGINIHSSAPVHFEGSFREASTESCPTWLLLHTFN